MATKALSSIIMTATTVAAIEPEEVPQFRIDFDLPASVRYNEMFTYFKDGM